MVPPAASPPSAGLARAELALQLAEYRDGGEVADAA